jgi:hypothetical protein
VTIRFELPMVPPSVNDEQRAHWRTRAHKVRTWNATVAAHAYNLRLKRDPMVPAIVTHTFECRGDGSNREKYATDALVSAGLLHDDRWPYVVEVRVRGRRMTRGEFWTCEIVDCDQEARNTP